jgi:hypothetical protein
MNAVATSSSSTTTATTFGQKSGIKTMKKLFSSAMFLGVALAAVACGTEYERTEISAVVPAKLQPSRIDAQQLQVPEGMIIKAHIVVWNDDNVQMPIEIRVTNNEIVEVASVISDRDYAFIGKQAGHTQIQLLTEGQPVVTIEADVVAQPDLPPSLNGI